VLLAVNAPPSTPRAKIVRRAVHGVLLLDKPLGLSSNDALQKAKRLYRAEKAGHTGTLDPLATGLLPLCFGAATKFSQVSLDADKRYLATLQLGVTTTTGDAEGDVMTSLPVDATREQVQEACSALTGPIQQLPPMYSALKKDGKALYEYARQGIDVERQARSVTIHQIDIVEGDNSVWVLDVRCSKGTYIRTLAEDIGKHLGCGAHLKALRRTGSGTLSIEHSHSLEQLAVMSELERDAVLMPADQLLADWPEVVLSNEDAGRFLSGMRRRLPLADAPNVRVYGPPKHTFLGSGHVTAGELISTRLLSPVEVQSLLNLHPNTKTAESAT
jgi:tRNA pseudouridine55 synthase